MKRTSYWTLILTAGVLLLTQPVLAFAQTNPWQNGQSQPRLAQALGDMYAACLFEGDANNPFSQAAQFSRQVLGPSLSRFIESNLAAIPLTPPSLDAEFVDDRIVTVVSGFTPIFTESSATVGQGRFLVGSNFSYFNLTSIRGQDLSDIQFGFEQDGSGDRVIATMPLSMEAQVFSLFGTYGITDRLDVGIAIPIVRFNIENAATNFRVEGDQTGCRYNPELGPNCNAEAPQGNRDVNVVLNNFADLGSTEMHISTVAVRAKYRFPTTVGTGRVAAVLDVRLPVGRGQDSMFGEGRFGTRLNFIGEYHGLDTFKPYVNVGAQFWNGQESNSLLANTGFTQQLSSRIFFAFDLLGKLALEPDPFLTALDNQITPDLSLRASSIPAVEREHTVHAGLGLQIAVTTGFQLYGSALFSLLDRGLQAPIAPMAGAAFYF